MEALAKVSLHAITPAEVPAAVRVLAYAERYALPGASLRDAIRGAIYRVQVDGRIAGYVCMSIDAGWAWIGAAVAKVRGLQLAPALLCMLEAIAAESGAHWIGMRTARRGLARIAMSCGYVPVDTGECIEHIKGLQCCKY